MSRLQAAAMAAVFLAAGAAGAGIAGAQQPAAPPQTSTIETRTTLAASPADSRPGTVLTAHVTDATGNAMSAGSVTFESAAGSLGAAAVDANGDASIEVGSVARSADGTGTTAQAVYHPAPAEASQAAAAGSVSANAQLEPEASGVPNFTITANPASLTVTQGDYGTTVLSIAPQNGFAEQVSLSCSNLPAQATCTFTPVTGNTTNGAFASTLQIQTQAASGAVMAPEFGVGPRPRHRALAWLLPGVLALAGLASVRRRTFGSSTRLMGLALLLVAGSLGLGGCNPRYGYEHHPPQVATGTLAGTYTINIAAAGNDGSAVTSHTLSLALTVQ